MKKMFCRIAAAVLLDFIPVELARLFYSRIKPKVSVELLG